MKTQFSLLARWLCSVSLQAFLPEPIEQPAGFYSPLTSGLRIKRPYLLISLD